MSVSMVPSRPMSDRWLKTLKSWVGRSGDLLNTTTGEVVASTLSFADNGISTDSGINLPSAIMPLTWSADGHFASVFLNGIG